MFLPSFDSMNSAVLLIQFWASKQIHDSLRYFLTLSLYVPSQSKEVICPQIRERMLN
jgi:hypothetical protein